MRQLEKLSQSLATSSDCEIDHTQQQIFDDVIPGEDDKDDFAHEFLHKFLDGLPKLEASWDRADCIIEFLLEKR